MSVTSGDLGYVSEAQQLLLRVNSFKDKAQGVLLRVRRDKDKTLEM